MTRYTRIVTLNLDGSLVAQFKIQNRHEYIEPQSPGLKEQEEGGSVTLNFAWELRCYKDELIS